MHAHENPFRTHRLEALRFRDPDVDVESLLRRLDQQQGRGSLVGPKGSGKTTLLLELVDALRERGLVPRVVRLNEAHRRPDFSLLADMDRQTALLLDGAEQLPLHIWWRVRWLARNLPCFITTSHMRPHLPLLHRHRSSPELLRELVCELHGAVTLPDADLVDLYARNAGNIRNCLLELYDREAVGP
jgi:hypothetical protein